LTIRPNLQSAARSEPFRATLRELRSPLETGRPDAESVVNLAPNAVRFMTARGRKIIVRPGRMISQRRGWNRHARVEARADLSDSTWVDRRRAHAAAGVNDRSRFSMSFVIKLRFPSGGVPGYNTGDYSGRFPAQGETAHPVD
jgi:hypothetical protein